MDIAYRIATILVLTVLSLAFTAIVGRKMTRRIRGFFLLGLGLVFAYLSAEFGNPSPFAGDSILLIVVYGLVIGFGATQTVRLAFVRKFLGDKDEYL